MDVVSKVKASKLYEMLLPSEERKKKQALYEARKRLIEAGFKHVETMFDDHRLAHSYILSYKGERYLVSLVLDSPVVVRMSDEMFFTVDELLEIVKTNQSTLESFANNDG